jgi:osmotically-inducible protein OsmY
MRATPRASRASLIFAAIAGAVGQFFFDRHSGKRRRHGARDRFAAFFRRRLRELSQKARYAEGVVEGAAYKAAAPVRKAGGKDGEIDDVTLARKVETVIFRDRNVPKGDINVDAEHGIVHLRGQLDSPEQIRDLVKATRKVKGVRDVESLLHLPVG